jgi:phosphatidylglycerol:prolipoprotein diacylglycerol transferase
VGLVSLNAAALAPAEGALIGATAAFVYGSRRHLPLRVTLDALAPGLAAMAVAVAAAHIASGDAFGAATPAALGGVPWSVYLWDEYRHPSQFYEFAAALGVLGIAWHTRPRGLFPGSNFLLVVALSAAARVFLEAFRGDSLVIAGGWRAAQVVGLAILAACVGAIRYWARETAQAP